MPLSPADQAVLADMEQREIHLKRRRQAESLIAFRARRFTTMLICVGVVIGVLISLGVIEVARMLMNHESGWVVPTILNAIFAAFLGSEVTQHLLRTRLGQRWIARFERRQRERFSAELHAGRRWLEFYYKRENIGPYVPQVLLFLREGRFDSVAEAVDFARSSRRESPLAEARALERFQTIAHEATGLVVSSTDREGQPSSRVMRFVTTERPGVWLITTAPYAPKVPELELGRIAIETLRPPTVPRSPATGRGSAFRRCRSVRPQLSTRSRSPGTFRE